MESEIQTSLSDWSAHSRLLVRLRASSVTSWPEDARWCRWAVWSPSRHSRALGAPDCLSRRPAQL